jgi:serine/threonine-protein kinase
MGEVWRATDTVLARIVAVKVMRAHLLDDEGFGARFRAEARTMAALHHPGVVAVYDYGEVNASDSGRVAYLVMAYVHGEPLSERIAAAGRLSPAQTMALISQAASALQAAHDAGVIHRDVKPENLLVEATDRVVLVDFGIARTSENAGLTGVNQMIGTARYMSPEQISNQSVSTATDIYALGAVAYHCLAGHPPFIGDTVLAVALHHLGDEPPPLPDDVPGPVRDLVATAMAKEPDARYPSAAAMATAAATATAATMATPAAAAVPSQAAGGLRPAGTESTLTFPAPRRRRGLMAAVIAGFVGLVALVIGVALIHHPAKVLHSPGSNDVSTGATSASPKATHTRAHSGPTGAGAGDPTGAPHPSHSAATTAPPVKSPSPINSTPPSTDPTTSPPPADPTTSAGSEAPSSQTTQENDD